MRKPNPREFSWIPFVDLLINMLAGFLCLFAVAMVTQGKPSEGGTTLKGEFIVQMEWQEGNINDVDLWVRQGDGKIVSFIQKDIRSMSLDRDNLGKDDQVRDRNGNVTRILPKNEMVTIRGITPGLYTINAHLYTYHSGTQNPRVLIKIFKINPYMEVYKGEKILEPSRPESTFVRFRVNEKGYVSDVDPYYQELFAKEALAKRPRNAVGVTPTGGSE